MEIGLGYLGGSFSQFATLLRLLESKKSASAVFWQVVFVLVFSWFINEKLIVS